MQMYCLYMFYMYLKKIGLLSVIEEKYCKYSNKDGNVAYKRKERRSQPDGTPDKRKFVTKS